MTCSFDLDPRLRHDTVFVTALTLSDLRLMNDSRWPWLVLVPRLAGAQEWHRLSCRERAVLDTETSRIAALLEADTGCDKINIGALGNIVRQLHIHIVARKAGDSNWPGPVWGYGQRQPYDENALTALVQRYQALLAHGG